MEPIRFWQHPARARLAVIMPRASRRGLRFADHTHAFHELGMVLEGECDWVVGGRRVALRAGDVVLVPAGAVHREEVPADARARLAWLGFDFAGEPPAMPAPLLRVLSTRGYEPDFRRIIEVVCTERQGAEEGHDERAALALRELLVLLCRLRPADGAPEPRAAAKQARAPQLVQSAALTLTGNLSQPLRIGDLARYHSLTPSHFALLFRKHRGETPRSFLQKARLGRAEELLRAGELNVKEIAAACGYVDAAHFCHAFKAATRLTPKQFRKKHAAAAR